MSVAGVRDRRAERRRHPAAGPAGDRPGTSRPYSLTATPSWVEAGIDFVKELLRDPRGAAHLHHAGAGARPGAAQGDPARQPLREGDDPQPPGRRSGSSASRWPRSRRPRSAGPRSPRPRRSWPGRGGGAPMIAAMEKVLVAGRALDRRAVLEAVRRAGVVHVEPVERREMLALPAVREELALAGRALEILEAVAPRPMRAPRNTRPPVVIERVLALAAALEACRAAAAGAARRAAAGRARGGGSGSTDLQALLAAGLHVEFFTCPAGAAGGVRAETAAPRGPRQGAGALGGRLPREIVIEAPAIRVPIPARDAAAIDRALGGAGRGGGAPRRRAGRHERPAGRICGSYRLRLQDQQRLLEVESGLHDAGEIFVLKGWVPSRDAAGLAAALEPAGGPDRAARLAAGRRGPAAHPLREPPPGAGRSRTSTGCSGSSPGIARRTSASSSCRR